MNVVLDDEDEKVQMTFSYPTWNDAWNVEWSHKGSFVRQSGFCPDHIFLFENVANIANVIKVHPIVVMLRLQDSGDAVDQEKFIELWKRELEQCNHILDDDFVGPQLSPACAIVGAHMAQEAIKAQSSTFTKDDPLRNVFFYSAIDTSGIVCYLPPMKFPFPFYMVVGRVAMLPATIGDAIRQWFELTARDS
ncbi:hypothetical protein DINM_022493 [Dirofilaria immitis]|nr:hypothetical protein [Dirofilaria immitis]